MLKAYLKYRRSAVNAHKIHSPFVFEFYNEVVKKVKDVDDAYIQKIRNSLLHDHREIQITDLGQGSKKNSSDIRKISEIARVQSISKKYGRLLSRMVEHYKLKYCVELGTSLGLGTAYLSMNAKEVITIEGSESVQEEAKKAWSEFNAEKVEHHLGNFDQKLPEVLKEVERLDLIYIDGNHGYEPTINYFNQSLAKAHNDTFIVFDDINWSEDMRKAWEEIIKREEIHVSLEFLRMGIALKREEQAKEHFVLKF